MDNIKHLAGRLHSLRALCFRGSVCMAVEEGKFI